MPVLRRSKCEAAIKPFQDLIGGIAAQNKLVAPPKRWDSDATGVKQHSVTEGALMLEIKESLGGLFFIRAESYDEAVEIAKGCPVAAVMGRYRGRSYGYRYRLFNKELLRVLVV